MIEALFASFAIALLSFSGAFLFGKRYLTGSHRFILPIAAGVFIGVIFFELVPETLETAGVLGSLVIASGFLLFYFFAHIIETYHHHHHKDDLCEKRTGAFMLLIGDGIHNIADGVVIASAFLLNPAVGIATAIGIALHEIPQEVAEFGVLLNAGYTKKKALSYNFLSALSIVLGVLLTYLFISFGDFLWILTGLAAGNLLYIVTSDMMPELRSDEHKGHFVQTFVSTIIGFLAIILLLQYSHEAFGHELEGTHTEKDAYHIEDESPQ